MDTITITVAENDPDVIVSATLNEDAVTITLNEAATGATGPGVPTGGFDNDILKKTSSTNYDTEWETPTSAATASTIVRRDASGGAAFVALTGTGNWSTTGHFLSNPSTSEAGHFLTKNGTTPTLAAGRSAWFSSTAGDPQFRNGTGSAVTLIYNGSALGTPSSGTLTNCTGLPVSTGISGLGTGVATFLATPSSANLIAAVTDETGTGLLVFNSSPTIHDLDIQDSVNFNAGSYNYGTGEAALHRTALELTALATTTPGAGVATFLATPSSANLLAALTTSTGTGSAVFATSPTITTPTIAQINGGTAANDDLTLQGTTNSTRTTSYVIVQPNGGFTGIGTSSPALPLHIVSSNANAGMFRAQNLSANGYTGFELYGDAGTQLAAFGTGNSTAGFYPGEMYLGTNTAKSLRFYTTSAGNVRMSISATGGVSIGTTTDAGANNLLVAGRINLGTTVANPTTANFILSQAAPQFIWEQTGAAANNRLWDSVVYNTSFRLRVVNDANSSATDYFAVTRTANVVDSITMTATTMAHTGNVTVSGTTTLTGGVVYGTFTVGTFPSTTYLEAVVTDALTPVVGATVAAGGSAKCKVMYNGSAKIVTAVL